MSVASTARVPTGSGSRYLQQLCKHWSHNLAVEFTPEKGKVVFPRNARGADWPVGSISYKPSPPKMRVTKSLPSLL